MLECGNFLFYLIIMVREEVDSGVCRCLFRLLGLLFSFLISFEKLVHELEC